MSAPYPSSSGGGATATSNPQAPPTFRHKLIAFVALAMTSTCVGSLMKLVQGGSGGSSSGRYGFNPLSAIVLTEGFKLVSSLFIIFGLVTSSMRAKQQQQEEEYQAVLEIPHSESVIDVVAAEEAEEKRLLNLVTFKSETMLFWQENFSLGVFKHEIGLAVAYSIINCVTFAIFFHASASNFMLMKACSPVLTALILRGVSSKQISNLQWLSIVMQCVGLFVCQYDRCTRWRVETTGYLFIAINIIVSCTAGVWNEQIIKSYSTSVNAQNAMLYTAGVVINWGLYFVMPVNWLGVTVTGTGFFEGYDNWRVLAVIVTNGCVGLVITAVYRYADVVIKTFGLAGATAFLYVLEATNVLPTTKMPPVSLAIAGASVVFYASYLYMAPPAAAVLKSATNTELKALRGMEEGEVEKEGGIGGGSKTLVLALDKRVGLLCGLTVLAVSLMALYPFPCLAVVDINALAAAAAHAVQQQGRDNAD